MEKQILELMKRSQLEAFLKEKGISEQKIVCKMCNEELSLQEVAIIAVNDGELIFSCDKPFCFRHLRK